MSVAYVYASLGSQRLVFAIVPDVINRRDEEGMVKSSRIQKALVAEAKGMGYTRVYCSSIPDRSVPTRNEMRG